ncbi:MAG TPA: hypothetical protein VL181_09060 [Holophagaceae bacterium]|nr:hypothetical protein [Holophagaceae bacterium]
MVITARVGQEDGRPEVIATLTSDNKPVANAGVAFQLQRSFGELALGQDTTLDDGTAAAALPKELAPNPDGTWTFKIAITSPDALAGQAQTLRIQAPIVATGARQSALRELWARSAPWSLLITVLVLAGSAWIVYGYAVHQLHLIKLGGQDVQDT